LRDHRHDSESILSELRQNCDLNLADRRNYLFFNMLQFEIGHYFNREKNTVKHWPGTSSPMAHKMLFGWLVKETK
jgi:hypothetical protein